MKRDDVNSGCYKTFFLFRDTQILDKAVNDRLFLKMVNKLFKLTAVVNVKKLLLLAKGQNYTKVKG